MLMEALTHIGIFVVSVGAWVFTLWLWNYLDLG